MILVANMTPFLITRSNHAFGAAVATRRQEIRSNIRVMAVLTGSEVILEFRFDAGGAEKWQQKAIIVFVEPSEKFFAIPDLTRHG